MQKVIIFILSICVLVSCNSGGDVIKEKEKQIVDTQPKKIGKRDKVSTEKQPITRNTNLELSTAVEQQAQLNQPTEFIITIHNPEKIEAYDIALENILSQEWQYVSSQPEGKFTPMTKRGPAKLSWQLTNVPAEGKVSIKLQLKPVKAGEYRHSITAVCQDKTYEAVSKLSVAEDEDPSS